MASKFQNRLVGTIVLVAVGVIVLPGLLDGKKRRHENQFATIPLVPKIGEARENVYIPPVNQALLEHSYQKTEEWVKQKNAEPNTEQQKKTPETVVQSPIESEVKAEQQKAPKSDVKTELTLKPELRTDEKAPQGQAYVIQLGALKNAAKVNEIIASLRLSGYRAYTVPSTPMQGQITRVYVGPDTSKQKLQSILPTLNTLSGLRGEIKPFKVQ